MLIVPFCYLFNSYAYIVFLVAVLLSSFSRTFNFVPDLICNIYFDADKKDKNIMRIWVGFIGYGDVIALISMSILLYCFEWDWKYCLGVAIAVFFLSSLLFYLSVV